jgi:lysophospholipase L1-like esterase
MAWFPLIRGYAGSSPPALPIEMNEYMQVAIVGASIMEQAVNTSANRAVINNQLVTAGFSSAVYDRATATQDSAAILATLQSGSLDRFLEVADKTVVMVHAGGNDVSAGLPESTLDSNLRAIYQFIKDAGFTLIPTPISYRTSPTLDPSAPYNTNVVLPAITDHAPMWIPGGVPVFDMYKLTSDTPSYLLDGIHLTEAGKTAHRNLMAQVLIDNINIKTETNSDYIKQVYINFGTVTPYVAGAFVHVGTANGSTAISLNTDGSTIANATQITVSGATNTYNTGRTDQAVNVAPSQLNNESLESGIYIDGSAMTIDLSQSGVDSAATYTVKLSASRDTVSSDRVGEYTIGGVTQELDAAANPVESLTFSGVSGADLIASGVSVARKSGSAFAYLTSLLITME